ncbi:hypothetical protein [Methylobacterium sp.]|uniref:capsular polysaccharide export protein, LipB/KpsS family n=1 Tax=Methylobacterium sp. TaxID=409 RepID=UPI003B5CBE34
MELVQIFSFSSQSAIADAEEIRLMAESAGCSASVICYFDDHKSHTVNGSRIDTLCKDIGSAPYLSSADFFNAYGFVLNIADLMVHNICADINNLPHLADNSVFSGHLRGIYRLIHEKICTIEPRLVVVPHGAEVVSRITALVCYKTSTPYVFSESGFFSDYIFLDLMAPHFFRGETGVDRAWNNCFGDVENNAIRVGNGLIDRWLAREESKYIQGQSPGELAKLDEWLKLDARPIVFIAGQLATDANVVASLGSYSSYREVLRAAIASIQSEWRIIYKLHPFDDDSGAVFECDDNIFVCKHTSIFHLIKIANITATHSSNVGLEALIMQKPVITWGSPLYSGKNVSIDLYDPTLLGGALDKAVPPSASRVAALVGLIITTSLIRKGNGREFRARLEKAKSIAATDRLEHYGIWYKNLIKSLKNYLFSIKIGETIPSLTRLQFLLDLKSTGSSSHICDEIHRQTLKPAEYLFDIYFDSPEVRNRAIAEFQCRAVSISLADGRFAEEVEAYCQDGQDFLLWIDTGQFCSSKNLLDIQVKTYDAALKVAQSVKCTYGADLIAIDKKEAYLAHFSLRESAHTEITYNAGCSSRAAIIYKNILLPWQIFHVNANRRLSETHTLIGLDIEGHIIYGPNCDVPGGEWIANFDLSLIGGDFKLDSPDFLYKSVITVDVYCQKLDLVLVSESYGRGLASVSLPFSINSRCALEFRVFSHGVCYGSLRFGGVILVDSSKLKEPFTGQALNLISTWSAME